MRISAPRLLQLRFTRLHFLHGPLGDDDTLGASEDGHGAEGEIVSRTLAPAPASFSHATTYHEDGLAGGVNSTFWEARTLTAFPRLEPGTNFQVRAPSIVGASSSG